MSESLFNGKRFLIQLSSKWLMMFIPFVSVFEYLMVQKCTSLNCNPLFLLQLINDSSSKTGNKNDLYQITLPVRIAEKKPPNYFNFFKITCACKIFRWFNRNHAFRFFFVLMIRHGDIHDTIVLWMQCACIRCNNEKKEPSIRIDLQFTNKYFSMSTWTRSRPYFNCMYFSCAVWVFMWKRRIHTVYMLHVVRAKSRANNNNEKMVL